MLQGLNRWSLHAPFSHFSLAVGKQADIVIVNGDPTVNIQDIEKVEIVFKDGVGYDSQKLIESVKGQVGTR